MSPTPQSPLVQENRPASHRTLIFFGVGFALLYFIFTLLVIIYTPHDIGLMMRHGGVFFANRAVVSLVVASLVLLYCLAYLNRKSLFSSKQSLWYVIGFSMIFTTVFLLTPPFFSSDLFGYINRGIIANVHQINPYLVTPQELGYQSFVAWSWVGSGYGPLYTAFSMALTKVVGAAIPANLLVFRLVNVMALAVCTWLVYAIVQRSFPRYRYIAPSLFIWNPFILLEAIHSSHNDIFLLACILFTLYGMLRGWYVAAWFSIVIGFLIKFGTIIILPILILQIVRLPRRRALMIIGACSIASVAIIAAAYAPFDSFSGNVMNASTTFIRSTNLTFPQMIVIMLLRVGQAITGISATNNITFSAGFMAAFLAGAAYIVLSRRFQRPSGFIEQAFWLFMLFLFLLGSKFNVWYILWFAPLSLLVPRQLYRPLILLIPVYGLIYYQTLNVFIPNLFYCLALILYVVVLWRWKAAPQDHQAKAVPQVT